MRIHRSTSAGFALVAALVVGGAGQALAQPLGTAFTYQGRLTDGGNPASGTFDFQFVLMDSAAGGAQVGAILTRDDVVVTGGLFTVPLDFGAAFTGAKRFLEVGVRPGASTGAYTTLSPRQELSPSPNATFSLTTPWAGIGGKPAGFADDVDNDALGALVCPNGQVAKRVGGAWACADDRDHDHFGQGWSGSATNGLTITNSSGAAFRGVSTSVAPNSTGIYGEMAAPSGSAVQGSATSTANGAFPSGVFGSAARGFGVLGSTGDGVGVAGFSGSATGFGAGVNGVTNADSGTGVYGQATSTTGFAIGVRGDTASPTGIAVWGVSQSTSAAGSPIGVEGRTESPIGIGVNGFAASTTGAGFGVRGASSSTSGTGVIGSVPATTGETRGVIGESFSSAGVGVAGYNNAPAGIGMLGVAGAGSANGAGVRGVSAGSFGVGVFASAQHTAGQNFGLWGESLSTLGTGVHGQAWATTGFANGIVGRSYSTDGNGVFGQAMASTGQAWGVFGLSPSTAGVGVYGQSSPTSASSTGVGVWGRASATGGFGGYFENSSGGPALGVSAGGIRFSDGTTQTTAASAATGDITAVNAGAGLTGGGTSGAVTLGVAFSGSGVSTFVPRADHTHLNQVWTGVQGNAPVFRVNNTAACCGFSDGIWGQSDATGGGRGVVGYASAATGANYGVWGQIDADQGRGVFGLAAGGSGVTYGVYGQTNSPAGYAGFFPGRLATDTLDRTAPGALAIGPANATSVTITPNTSVQGTLTIGNGTPIGRVMSTVVTLGVITVPAGGTVSFNAGLTGAVAGDTVIATFPGALPVSCTFNSYVSAVNQATLVINNAGVSACTLPAAAYRLTVIQF